MKTLSVRNEFLLTEGARITGSFKEALEYNFENFFIDEYEDIKEFAEWIDDEVGGASSHNIYWLYEAFSNPKDKELQKRVAELKAKIAEIKNFLK